MEAAIQLLCESLCNLLNTEASLGQSASTNVTTILPDFFRAPRRVRRDVVYLSSEEINTFLAADLPPFHVPQGMKFSERIKHFVFVSGDEVWRRGRR